MIRERIARHLVIEVGCIVSILETRTEIEDSVMLSIATCQELAYGVSVVAVECFNAMCRKAAR